MTRKKATLMEKALQGRISRDMRTVAREEGISPDELCRLIADGKAVISRAGGGGGQPLGIGAGLRVKVNANLGTSKTRSSAAGELKKLQAAVSAGADAIMDLSTAGNLDAVRRAIIAQSPLTVGTVPIYQSVVETLKRYPGRIHKMTADMLFDAIEKQAADGVGFVTVHCGLNLESLSRIRNQGRILGIVSRGGAFLAEWMSRRGEENPLFSEYDRLLDIARRYDLILSLGDALRPGCIDDATDRGQIQELIVLGELTKRAREAGVQVMIEGPGHMPMDQIEANVLLQKKLCNEAPFYVLGPLVTDCAPGYDHITSAIGGAIAARAGADFLCYVTPSEHLGLPGIDDVHQGVTASRIAAHAADLARGMPSALDRDRSMARHRQALDWEGQERAALDPTTVAARRLRGELPAGQECTMCGPYCSIKGMKDILGAPPLPGKTGSAGKKKGRSR